jgi:SAM-dependent methyltransferase
MRKLVFDFAYWFTRPRWDTRITPPEVVAFVESHTPPGRALDLGCGTGTNVIYLAQHGWQAVGVDFVGKAIATARRRARAAGVAAQFIQGDVARLDYLQPPFDYALDIGCFHGLGPEQRAAYMAGLSRLLRPGGSYMLFARKPESGYNGITIEETLAVFGEGFTSRKMEHGTGRMPAAWYWFERK